MKITLKAIINRNIYSLEDDQDLQTSITTILEFEPTDSIKKLKEIIYKNRNKIHLNSSFDDYMNKNSFMVKGKNFNLRNADENKTLADYGFKKNQEIHVYVLLEISTIECKEVEQKGLTSILHQFTFGSDKTNSFYKIFSELKFSESYLKFNYEIKEHFKNLIEITKMMILLLRQKGDLFQLELAQEILKITFKEKYQEDSKENESQIFANRFLQSFFNNHQTKFHIKKLNIVDAIIINEQLSRERQINHFKGACN